MISREWGRDRLSLVTLALLLLVTVAAWVGVLAQAPSMMGGSAADAGMTASMELRVTPTALIGFVSAWTVMMVAMMVPSATPTILLYRTVARSQPRPSHPLVRSSVFVLAYLIVWAAVGIPVYLASGLVAAVFASDMQLAGWAPYGVALVLAAAGVYQFTPLKRVCLRACQSPLGFLIGHWKPGAAGAFRMGLEHGAYCTGCCWGLMAVLVAAGAMGLAWVLLIALVVAIEKLLRGQWAPRITGAALLGLGGLILVQPEMALVLRGTAM